MDNLGCSREERHPCRELRDFKIHGEKLNSKLNLL